MSEKKLITHFHVPADNRDGGWSCSECYSSTPNELWECEVCGEHFCADCAKALLTECGGYYLDHYTGNFGFCEELICEECRDKQELCNECLKTGAVKSFVAL